MHIIRISDSQVKPKASHFQPASFSINAVCVPYDQEPCCRTPNLFFQCCDILFQMGVASGLHQLFVLPFLFLPKQPEFMQLQAAPVPLDIVAIYPPKRAQNFQSRGLLRSYCGLIILSNMLKFNVNFNSDEEREGNPCNQQSGHGLLFGSNLFDGLPTSLIFKICFHCLDTPYR